MESTRLQEYLALWNELQQIRRAHAGHESAEENAILDRMDEAWARLDPTDLDELELRLSSLP